MANVCEFTDSNFETEVLQSAEPVLVDFWAPWCGPCRMLGPVIEQLAAENAGSVKVGKLDVQDNPTMAARYGISNIPAIMVFQGGQVVDSFIGVQPKDRLQSALDQVKA
ncbi:MAG: thioredoxin [Pirellulales bacterium]|nr:thioredoxin [Pirellulales bacterium]